MHRLDYPRRDLGPRDTVTESLADGSLVLRSPHPLGRYPRTLTDRLELHAREAPSRTFLAQREPTGRWRTIGYGEAMRAVRSIAQALLDRRLSVHRPIAILTGAGIEHALLALAALHAGLPFAPISPAYSTTATTFDRLREMLDLLAPELVFAADAGELGPAITAALAPDVELVVAGAAPADRPATGFDELLGTAATGDVDLAHAAITADAIAEVLFTSGSTGAPKGVVYTHRMLTSVQQMIVEAMPLFAHQPPVLLEWLPWHHGSGLMINGITVYNGGTLYIDDGKPLPGWIERTVANLRDVSPTAYFNVPKGFDALVPHLARDARLRAGFFSRLSLLYYSGAAMPARLWDALDALALGERGARVPIVAGYGTAEIGSFGLCANWEDRASSPVGLPVPGVELKLVPNGPKLECRMRGPNVTPGYWRQPRLTQAAFDEQGFVSTGDALRFVAPAEPSRGLAFDGRVGEDFKLSTGTWVRVGPLAERIVEHFSPLVRDAVIAGSDRDEIGVLIFPALEACRSLAGLPGDASASEILAHGAVRGRFEALLDALAATATGSSNRLARAILLDQPPDAARGEITDKGSINQKVVLDNRPAALAELYSEPASPRLLRARG